MSKIDRAVLLLRALLQNSGVDQGHGIDHAIAVLKHARKALEYEKVTFDEKLAVELASLLHDADDHKFFQTKDNLNTRRILNDLFSSTKESKKVKNMTIQMINLVGCSKNKNNIDPELPRFYYIPRWCDRLEAVGEIGLKRALIYNKETNRPLFLESTKRANSLKTLYEIATPERFENYTGGSVSFIDHLYDKVLHLKVKTNNVYIDKIFEERHKIIEEYCLNFN